jgi:hypothetical protein
VVVVKNPDIWASLERSGDWDLIADQTPIAYRTLTAILGEPAWVNHRSYVMNINWAWGHIDLLPDIRWRGIRLLSADAVLEGRIFTDDLPVARLAHQAVSACVFSVLAYGSIHPRYGSLWDIARREDSDELKAVVDRVFGVDCGIERMPINRLVSTAGKLRRDAVRHALRKDLTPTIGRSAAFAAREGWLRLNSLFRTDSRMTRTATG